MLTTEYICVIMRKRKQKACFLKGRKEEIKMRHCQYCDAHFAAACLFEYDCLACVRGSVRKCKRCSLLFVSTE
mgnify:CR=1 FL=1